MKRPPLLVLAAACARAGGVKVAAGERSQVRFWRGQDLEHPTPPPKRLAESVPLFGHPGRHLSLLQLLALAGAGLLARRRLWLPREQVDLLRQCAFRVLFPAFLLRNTWLVSFTGALKSIGALSLAAHCCWFAMSHTLARWTPTAELTAGPQDACLRGWMILMTMGEMMAFTYGVIAEAPSLADRALSAAVMWDVGGNMWVCQGLLWGVAAFYSPAARPQDCGSSCEMEDMKEPRKGGGGASRAGGGTLRRATEAALGSRLLHASVLGLLLNALGVPLGRGLDLCLQSLGAPFKVFLYFFAGYYADLDIGASDLRLIGCALLQRTAIQLTIGALACAALPSLGSLLDRQAVVLAVFSPVTSVVMHILAENDYGEHLVKLCVTGALVNVVSCTVLQHILIEFVFQDAAAATAPASVIA